MAQKEDVSKDFSDLLHRASALELRREKKRERIRKLADRLETSDGGSSSQQVKLAATQEKRGSVMNLVNRFEPTPATAKPATLPTTKKAPASSSSIRKIAKAPAPSAPRSLFVTPIAIPYRDNRRPSPSPIVPLRNVPVKVSTAPTVAIEMPKKKENPGQPQPASPTRAQKEIAYKEKFRILNDPETSPSEKLRIYLDSCHDKKISSDQPREPLSNHHYSDKPKFTSQSHTNIDAGIFQTVFVDHDDEAGDTNTTSQLPPDTLDIDITTPWHQPKPLDNIIWNYSTNYSDSLPTTTTTKGLFVDVDIGHQEEEESDDYDYVEDDDAIFQDEYTAPANAFLTKKRSERRRLFAAIFLFLLALISILSIVLVPGQNGGEIRPWTGDCFENKIELRMAVDRYLQDNSPHTDLAEAYGWPINSWCVSTIEDFSNLFRAEVGDGGSPIRIAMFDEDISDWDVSNAKLMSKMFLGAPIFNSDISNWNVKNVLDMERMFDDCPSFSSDLSAWDVSSVTNARSMFRNAKQFNSDLSKWEFAPDSMDGMFLGAERFSSDLNKFDVSKVTNFADVFSGATSFNGNISNWNMKQAERLDRMFDRAISFDGDLSQWKIAPRSIGSMFFFAESFTGRKGLNKWDVSGINDMHAVFYGSKFQGNISSWDLGSTTTTRQMFEGASNFDGDLSMWDVSKVRDFTSMFQAAETFSSDLSSWNVSSGLKFNRMFANATSFNSDLSSWEVSSAETISEIFADASAFARNLCMWGPQLSSLDWTTPDKGEAAPLLFGGTNCPEASKNPDYSISPPGPFCHPCT